jgi:hypothetical protein
VAIQVAPAVNQEPQIQNDLPVWPEAFLQPSVQELNLLNQEATADESTPLPEQIAAPVVVPEVVAIKPLKEENNLPPVLAETTTIKQENNLPLVVNETVAEPVQISAPVQTSNAKEIEEFDKSLESASSPLLDEVMGSDPWGIQASSPASSLDPVRATVPVMPVEPHIPVVPASVPAPAPDVIDLNHLITPDKATVNGKSAEGIVYPPVMSIDDLARNAGVQIEPVSNTPGQTGSAANDLAQTGGANPGEDPWLLPVGGVVSNSAQAVGSSPTQPMGTLVAMQDGKMDQATQSPGANGSEPHRAWWKKLVGKD